MSDETRDLVLWLRRASRVGVAKGECPMEPYHSAANEIARLCTALDAANKELAMRVDHGKQLREAQIRIREQALAAANERTEKVEAALAEVTIKGGAKVLELEQALAAANKLAERLKREAEIHAQEARTQRATVRAIYQAITKATGELGDWNGARPVVEYIERQEQALAAERAKRERAEEAALRLAKQMARAVEEIHGPGWVLLYADETGVVRRCEGHSASAAFDAALSDAKARAEGGA